MGHRVNIVLDDAAWRILQQLPKGERSKAVSAALNEWDKRSRRAKAAEQMDMLRVQLAETTTGDIVAGLRRDRERTE